MTDIADNLNQPTAENTAKTLNPNKIQQEQVGAKTLVPEIT
jgi:hypothetical protein